MKNRIEESLAPLFDSKITQDSALNLLLLSPSDVGVMRNKGRNGARFAPKAILNQLKKYNNHTITQPFLSKIVSSQSMEKKDFSLAQDQETTEIKKAITQKNVKKCIHIGGGHDHIYPLLCAIEDTGDYENILVLNIDAHCDTRIDDINHSGTPFRNFSQKTKTNFHLIQFGIQDFANSTSTTSPLQNAKVEHLSISDVKENSKNFTDYFDPFANVNFNLENKKTAIILSLDCDGIDGSSMRAVSAVNSNGIPSQYIFEIVKNLKSISNNYFFGIYELNPVFEDHSMLSTKTISSLIYEYLK